MNEENRSPHDELTTRDYGTSGPEVILIHGGPGAPGSMAPVARKLAESFRVFEPFQRRSSNDRLTVSRHITDLHRTVTSHCQGHRPALIGHSWGAILALAYSAAHNDSVGPLVLIGCGTFDHESRERMRASCRERMDSHVRQRMERLPEDISDPDERLRALGNLILPAFSYDLITTDLELDTCDARGYEETWEDKIRLEEQGIYPAAFATIDRPVLMLHGTEDPHPGQMIQASLKPFLPHLEYREWPRCGHYPWLERAARDEFYRKLEEWLGDQVKGSSA